MRRCGCGSIESRVEVACIMDGCWTVLCHDCGALAKHGATKDRAVKNWERKKLSRNEGYFRTRDHSRRIINLGRQICGQELIDTPPDKHTVEIWDEDDKDT